MSARFDPPPTSATDPDDNVLNPKDTVPVTAKQNAPNPPAATVVAKADKNKPRAAKFPIGWSSGSEAIQRIVAIKPVFGEERNGLKLGAAYSTPQRVFRPGKRIPIELFVMNVSNKEITFTAMVDFMAYPPHVVNAADESMKVSRLLTYMVKPSHKITLGPGEACGLTALGLGIGNAGPASFIDPVAGSYKLNYRFAGLTAGTLNFGVTKKEAETLTVRTVGTYTTGHATPERMGILKPVFGKPKHGIEIGAAFATMMREFKTGDRVPLDLFIRNVSEEELKIQFFVQNLSDQPIVMNSKGEKMHIPMRMRGWMYIGPRHASIKPGETWVYTAYGLGLSARNIPGGLKLPPVGKYTLRFSGPIKVESKTGKPRTASWSEHYDTGTLDFEAFKNEAGDTQIRLPSKSKSRADENAIGARSKGAKPAETAKKPELASNEFLSFLRAIDDLSGEEMQKQIELLTNSPRMQTPQSKEEQQRLLDELQMMQEIAERRKNASK